MENTKRILVLDHQPDKELFANIAGAKHAHVTYAAGYLQAVAAAMRARPDAIYIRRDLPWLSRSLPLVFLDNPLFSDIRVVFYSPEELRGELPSRNMHALPF